MIAPTDVDDVVRTREVAVSKLEAPPDWRTEVIYFLLPDRFSDGCPPEPAQGAHGDGGERDRLLDRSALAGPNGLSGQELADFRLGPAADGPLTAWYWDHWAISGRNRFQGGTIRGVERRLGYLQRLGVTTIWLGPVWKQRAADTDTNANGDGTDDPFHPPQDKDVKESAKDVDFRAAERSRDSYHGYAIQDFDAVDPRFGTEEDLCQLVSSAHALGMYVVFDIMINHSAENWVYDVPPAMSILRPPYPPPDCLALPVVNGRRSYEFGAWLGGDNQPLGQTPLDLGADDAVRPAALQDPDLYSRQGEGDYGVGRLDDQQSEFRISDYRNRDFHYPPEESASPVLDEMVAIWSRWIEKTDCDGFRIDTFKHVPFWVAESFSERIKAGARSGGRSKPDFLVMGEVGGSEEEAASYQAIPSIDVFELSSRRAALRSLAAGDVSQRAAVLDPNRGRSAAAVEDLSRVVMSMDDHDGLGLQRQVRIAAEKGPASVVAAAALLLFTAGVPCLYYGTEQALCGPVGSADPATHGDFLAEYGLDLGWAGAPPPRQHGGDRYLREAMFGPQHPRLPGARGRPDPGGDPDAPGLFDRDLPGFGPMGTSGYHVFDERSE